MGVVSVCLRSVPGRRCCIGASGLSQVSVRCSVSGVLVGSLSQVRMADDVTGIVDRCFLSGVSDWCCHRCVYG